jgi:hypothetical protein
LGCRQRLRHRTQPGIVHPLFRLVDERFGLLNLCPREVRLAEICDLRGNEWGVLLVRSTGNLFLGTKPLRPPHRKVLSELMPGGHLLLKQHIGILTIPHLSEVGHQTNRPGGSHRSRAKVSVNDRIETISHREETFFGRLLKERRGGGIRLG